MSRYNKMISIALIDAKLILCTPFAAVHLGNNTYEATQVNAASNTIPSAICCLLQ